MNLKGRILVTLNHQSTVVVTTAVEDGLFSYVKANGADTQEDLAHISGTSPTQSREGSMTLRPSKHLA